MNLMDNNNNENNNEKKLEIIRKRNRRGIGLGGSSSSAKKNVMPPEQTISEAEEIAERLYSLRNKNLQLKTDSLHFGADICDTMVEQNKLMRSLKAIIRQSDEKNERQIAPVIEALKTLEERIANSADAADARTEKKLEEIFSHLDDAGKAYSKGLCERLDRTVGAYDALLEKGHENLEFWSLSKKMIVFILTMLLLFQLSLNYKMKNELQGLHTQVSMIHSLYKGDTKYWFDPDNQMTYVETLKQYEQRE